MKEIDYRSLLKQLDVQLEEIEDLKETVRSLQRTIEFQNASLRELGVMSAHYFNGRLNKVLRYEERRIGLN